MEYIACAAQIAAFRSSGSKYEKMSNSDLLDAICNKRDCNDCPMPDSEINHNESCDGYLANHPELRQKLIQYLEAEDKED